MKNWIFRIWCFPQNLVGYIMSLIYSNCPQEELNGRKIIYWGVGKNGASMGKYLFIPDNTIEASNQQFNTQNFIVHEYGHTIQSLLWGPLWFLVFGFESMLWCLVWPYMCKYQIKKGLPPVKYSSFYAEKSANRYGEKELKNQGLYW